MRQGLTSEEVRLSREKHGANTLTPPIREAWWKLLLSKFKDPIIQLLLFATLLSVISGFFHGSMTESIGILLAIFLATFLSFINEYKAGKEFDILNTMSDTAPVKVVRDGVIFEISKTELVVGDIVLLEQGDEVPADGRVLEAVTFSINESTLNGESVPARKVAKSDEEVIRDGYEGAYPPNMIYRGTTIVEGNGVMEIVAVGDSTEIGKTARQAAEITGEQTPLNKQLARLSKLIGKIGFTVAGVTFLALVVRGFMIGELQFVWSLTNFEIILTFFMIAVTLIVVAVPEGLAMSVTLSLAYSMRRMTAEHTLVRKMHACETMGATNVICTDKTGTLTQNIMKVQYCSEEITPFLAEMIASNTTAHLNEKGVIGNATEGALLLMLKDHGIDYAEYRYAEDIVARLPFSTERKLMATLLDSDFVTEENEDQYSLYIKGAPEIVISLCKFADESDGSNHPVQRKMVEEEVVSYQKKGMRLLAFAKGYVKKESVPDNPTEEDVEKFIYSTELSCCGIVAIADPIRVDVPPAMRACIDAGIEVKIVTGDNSLTAKEIARQSGLWTDEDDEDKLITGRDFSMLTDEEAYQKAQIIKVMSRARPNDKLRLVKMLQKAGKVVAVTGDGTNDAPALNHADVGLAMGSGTAVAKEASDIVLLNDSFASIINAVQWGRSIYLNIQRFIQFQLTINVVALLTALIGPFIGVEFPLTVTQMLWVNLIMDTFAALALATEPSDKKVLQQKPRSINDFIITKKIWRNILVQGFTFLIIVAFMILFFMKYSEGHEWSFGLNVWIEELASMNRHELSVFFTAFVMMQFWNLFNVRTAGTGGSAFNHFFKNKRFIVIVLLILILQIIIVQFGGDFFRTVPLRFGEWVLIIVSTSFVLWVGEIIRFIGRVRNRKLYNNIK